MNFLKKLFGLEPSQPKIDVGEDSEFQQIMLTMIVDELSKYFLDTIENETNRKIDFEKEGIPNNMFILSCAFSNVVNKTKIEIDVLAVYFQQQVEQKNWLENGNIEFVSLIIKQTHKLLSMFNIHQTKKLLNQGHVGVESAENVSAINFIEEVTIGDLTSIILNLHKTYQKE